MSDLALNSYPKKWPCTKTECAHQNRFHHDVSGRCTISGCACVGFSPLPIVPENPNSDKHHLAFCVPDADPQAIEDQYYSEGRSILIGDKRMEVLDEENKNRDDK